MKRLGGLNCLRAPRWFCASGSKERGSAIETLTVISYLGTSSSGINMTFHPRSRRHVCSNHSVAPPNLCVVHSPRSPRETQMRRQKNSYGVSGLGKSARALGRASSFENGDLKALSHCFLRVSTSCYNHVCLWVEDYACPTDASMLFAHMPLK